MAGSLFGRGPHKPFCDDFEAKLDSAIKTLKSAHKFVDKKVADLKSAANDLIPEPTSPPSSIDSANNTVTESVKEETPDFTNVNDVLNVFNACGLMKSKIQFSSQTNVEKTISKHVQKGVNNAISNVGISLAGIAEYPVSVLSKQINEYLAKIKIPDLLGNIDKYMECIDAMCGRDLSSKIDEVNELMEGWEIDETGFIDTNKIISSVGVAVEKVTNVNSLLNNIAKQETAALNTIAQSTNLISTAMSVAKSLF